MSTDLYQQSASYASAEARGAFLRRTYLHLAFAVLAFIGVEALLLRSPLAPAIVGRITGGYTWLLVLLAFMGISTLAERWARSDTSVATQYLGLGVYILAEAIIFLPLLYFAAYFSRSANVIPAAGIITGLLFAGLTFTAFTSSTDFSFLRGALTIGGFVALGVIVASLIFGFELGVFFSAVMVVFAGASILYQTSNVLRQYRTDQHVAAALALFASVALLFFYILRLLSSRR